MVGSVWSLFRAVQEDVLIGIAVCDPFVFPIPPSGYLNPAARCLWIGATRKDVLQVTTCQVTPTNQFAPLGHGVLGLFTVPPPTVSELRRVPRSQL